MSDLASADPPAAGPPDRCLACGQPIASLDDGCCPLCSHRIQDEDVTSEDRTPYARARADGERGWWAMCRWVFTAGKHRLAHLGLLRPSTAARHFARINCVLFAAAVGFSVFTNTGWHLVTRAPGVQEATTPNGYGWLHVVERQAEAKDRFAQVFELGLWWNVLHATLCGLAAMVAALLGTLLVVRVIGSGGGRSLRKPDRGVPRLRCAVDYGTAWMAIVTVAVVLTALRPLANICRIVGLGGIRSPVVFDVPAVLIGLAGALLGWFWLIRLAQTTPKETRSTVASYFVVQAPVIVIVIAGGLGSAFWFGSAWMADRLNLIW